MLQILSLYWCVQKEIHESLFFFFLSQLYIYFFLLKILSEWWVSKNKLPPNLLFLCPGVTVCLMSVLGVKPGEKGESILLSRLEKDSSPVTVHISTSRQRVGNWCYSGFRVFSLKKNKKLFLKWSPYNTTLMQSFLMCVFNRWCCATNSCFIINLLKLKNQKTSLITNVHPRV